MERESWARGAEGEQRLEEQVVLLQLSAVSLGPVSILLTHTYAH